MAKVVKHPLYYTNLIDSLYRIMELDKDDRDDYGTLSK